MMEKEITYTPSQQEAISQLLNFIDSVEDKVFILKGYAGTGKTTLVKELIRILKGKEKSFYLLASTGRAAKILSNITESPAETVHSKIYTYQDFNQDIEAIIQKRELAKTDQPEQLYLQFIMHPISERNSDQKMERYYIIDESSMISDMEEKEITQALFGSGRLLKDLLTYDSKGKFIFVGDVCQLPPINQTFSPALSVEYFHAEYQMKAQGVELTEIVRQEKTNDIVKASHKIRALYANCPTVKWGKFPLRGCNNIKIFPDQASLLQDYVKRIKQDGYNNATFICRTNRICDTLTSLIRPFMGLTMPTLQVGDLLLVTQNNYISGLMNGDLVEIVSLGQRTRKAKLTFIHVEIKELVTQKIYSQLLIEEILYQSQTNLTQEQQKELFIDFYLRMKAQEIKQKSDTFNTLMIKDIYLNALRAVFGFALTCHKAQGGEWEHVYLDLPSKFAYMPGAATYQWLYTAMTRAKKQLYITEGFWLI
jgi:ATP-dependent exoDNAse (exonuclease V) alpha subunit